MSEEKKQKLKEYKKNYLDSLNSQSTLNLNLIINKIVFIV